jgi:hypothetical protein
LVAGILEEYAQRGVFRGFSHGLAAGGEAGFKKAGFKIVWHYDREMDLTLDERSKTLTFTALLPALPARSAMYREFKEFLESRHSPELLEHRRIDPKKAHATCRNSKGSVSVTLTVRAGGFEYGTRKLVNLVDEIFKDFLFDHHQDYLVERHWLDLDRY